MFGIRQVSFDEIRQVSLEDIRQVNLDEPVLYRVISVL
jgi:hypothetical protein